ncbi:PepSY domain-containing protein [Sulfurospirillum sp. 1307]|jgi:uncharacterized membrane protein YkoI
MKKSSYFVKGLVVLSLIGTMAMADASKESNDENKLQVKSSIQVKESTNEVDEKSSAKLGVEEVAKIAKNQFGGNVIDVQLENINGNLVYQADVLNNNQITNVLIDAGNGKILASKVEKNDSHDKSDNEGDENDGENENDGSWYKFWS